METTSYDTHFTPQVPMSFLRQVAECDELRADLERDPAATLAVHGFCLNPEQLPIDVSLPSGEALQGSLKAAPNHFIWHGQLTS